MLLYIELHKLKGAYLGIKLRSIDGSFFSLENIDVLGSTLLLVVAIRSIPT